MAATPGFCSTCGAPLRPGSRFCASCGAPTAPQPEPPTERSPGSAPGTGIGDRTEVLLGAGGRSDEPPTQRTPAPPYASIGSRLLGQLVDGLIAFGVFVIVGALVANRTGDPTENGFDLTGGAALAAIGIAAAVVLAYFIVAEALTGVTTGKLAAGLQVRSTDGLPIGFGAALVRNLLRLVDGIGFYLVGGIVALTSPRRQRLGDAAAGTVVLRRPVSGARRAGAVLAALALAAAGIGGCWAVREPATAEATVTATLARGATPDRRPVDPTTTFAPDQETIYLTFTVSGARPGAVLRSVWTAVNVGAAAPPNTTVDEATVTLARGADAGVFTLRRSGPRWAPGQYRADLYLDDRLVESLPYTVTGQAAAATTTATATARPTRTPTVAPRTATSTPARTGTPTVGATRSPSPTASPLRTPTGTGTPAAHAPAPPGPQTGGPLTVTLARAVTADYQPVEPATTFPPNAERIYAAFKASGAGRGAVVKTVWIAVYVGASQPPNSILDEASVTLPQGNELGAFSIRRTSPAWPEGEYSVEFYVNDRLVLTVPYRIAP